VNARANGIDTAIADGDGEKAPVPACACPVAAFQKLISGKYKLRIVWDLKDGALRYSEIRNGLLRGAAGSREIAPRVLSRELRALTESGLIERKDFGVVPPKVEYKLTRTGHSFVPVIAAIREWGAAHLTGTPMARRDPHDAAARRVGTPVHGN
jgi:DNA-binding HxlR family transcriptional regulator